MASAGSTVQSGPGLPLLALRASALRHASQVSGWRLVVLFGSIAQGSPRADSDASGARHAAILRLSSGSRALHWRSTAARARGGHEGEPWL